MKRVSFVALIWLAGIGAVASLAHAEALKLSCTETLAKPDESGAATADHQVTIIADEPATLTIDGPWGNIALPARVARSSDASMPDAVSINAFGEASMRMPIKSEVDACMDEARKKHPEYFEGDEINDFIAVGCRNEAGLTPEPVPITMRVEVAIFEPPEVAIFFIERAYAGDDSNATRLYGIATLPPWNCRMTAP